MAASVLCIISALQLLNGVKMKPITINELAPLVGSSRFRGGFFATKPARIAVLVGSVSIALGLGFGAQAWGLGAVLGVAVAFLCLIMVPATIRRRYAVELIEQDLPERITYLYRKYKEGNRRTSWIDPWYEAFNNGKAMKPSQMLVILQYTWISAYGGLSAKRAHLKHKNLQKS